MRIVSSNEGFPHAYTAGQRVELWCQLSRAEVPVCWYKDGQEVEEGESLVLEREGTRCRLVLPCARPQDAGEFVCDAGGDSVFYTITVAGGCVGTHPRVVHGQNQRGKMLVACQRCFWCLFSSTPVGQGALWQLWCIKPPGLAANRAARSVTLQPCGLAPSIPALRCLLPGKQNLPQGPKNSG